MGTEVPEDLRVRELPGYYMDKLLHLKHWIYQKRTEARKHKIDTQAPDVAIVEPELRVA
jgi:hypothetical protein